MKKIFLFAAINLVSQFVFAQNVGIGTNTPNSSALLDLSSTAKGFLPPRLTTLQRTAIVSPATGLIVFDSNTGTYWYYTGTIWREMNSNPLDADINLYTEGAQTTGNLASNGLTSGIYDAGYLYDSGGASGNYGNNEDFTYHIYTLYHQVVAIDVTIIYLNTESPYDSLVLSDQYAHKYLLTGTASNVKYRFFGDVDIRFVSNSANTSPGFYILWRKVFVDNSSSGYDNTILAGWYFNPIKMYMRGGINFNDNWRPDSSGIASFSFNGQAKGDFSFSVGKDASAKNLNSVSIGTGSVASFQECFAFGPHNFSSGFQASAIGAFNTTTNYMSTALGNNCWSGGKQATAVGSSCTALADSSLAMGNMSTTSGVGSSTLGYNLLSKAFGCVSVGVFNDTSDMPNVTGQSLNRIFQVGNGYNSARSNAMTILQNGNVGIGELVPAVPLNMASVTGNKISFSGNGTYHYGIGTQTNLLQMYTPSIAGDIVFGYGNSYSFTDNMRIKGTGDATLKGNFILQTGYVGIGEPAPAVPLNFKAITGNKISFFGNGTNHFGVGTQAGLLQMYAPTSSDDIAFGYGNSNSFTENMRIKGTGDATLKGNFILQTGYVGIGEPAPAVPLNFKAISGNKISFFGNSTNHFGIGTQTGLLQMYSPTSTDDIAFGYGNSNSFTENMRVKGTGDASLKGSFTVQNGKGLIRTISATQEKKLSASVVVSASFTAGETKTFAVAWPESFSAAPEAYVGNVVSGSGGWAEVVMTIAGAGTSGATLYVYNPRTTPVTPNFTVKVIAIGAQ